MEKKLIIMLNVENVPIIAALQTRDELAVELGDLVGCAN